LRLHAALLLIALGACDRHAGASHAEPRGAPAAQPSSSARRLDLDELRDGDLVFQQSKAAQSEMVGALTRSKWTHMGVVFVDPSGPVVLEAVSPVRWTRLREWTARGVERRYVVKRLRDAETTLSPAVIAEMRALGKRWQGRPYDLKFRWDDETLYCSELAYKLYERAARLELGRVERARDMNLEDPRVKRAQVTRFKPGEFDPDEPVVTPDSIFRDERLLTVRD